MIMVRWSWNDSLLWCKMDLVYVGYDCLRKISGLCGNFSSRVLNWGFLVISIGAINWLKWKGIVALIGCVLLLMNRMCNCGW